MRILFFFTVYRNESKENKFWWQKNRKSDFYKNKKIFNIDDIDVNKILVSKKEPYGKNNSFKYFTGFNDNDVIRPLRLKLSKMTGYVKTFEENKSKKNKFKENITMSLRVNNKQLLKNYNKIWKEKWKVNGYRFWQQTCLWLWW